MQIGVKYPETQMSVLACTVSYLVGLSASVSVSCVASAFYITALAHAIATHCLARSSLETGNLLKQNWGKR